MMTFFQGLPGQQPVPGTLDFPGSPQKLRSTSEVDSEASMSEASSEDLLPPLGRDEEGTVKKKKPKVLANMFSVFTKGRKKGQPSSSEPEGRTEPQPGLEDRLPTGRMVPHVGRGPLSEPAKVLGRAGAHRVDGLHTQDTERAGAMALEVSPLTVSTCTPYLILEAGVSRLGFHPVWDTTGLSGRII